MPIWTISAPRDFQESVKETARKLGLRYGEYLRKAHRAYLEKLTSDDFERAKKLMELSESKERLGALRERETVLLREKGYKDRNVRRILRDVEDPEIREEIERLSRLREEEANTQLRLHEELNPTDEKQFGHPPKSAKPVGHEVKNKQKIARMKAFGLSEQQYEAIEKCAKEYGETWFESYNELFSERERPSRKNEFGLRVKKREVWQR